MPTHTHTHITDNKLVTVENIVTELTDLCSIITGPSNFVANHRMLIDKIAANVYSMANDLASLCVRQISWSLNPETHPGKVEQLHADLISVIRSTVEQSTLLRLFSKLSQEIDGTDEWSESNERIAVASLTSIVFTSITHMVHQDYRENSPIGRAMTNIGSVSAEIITSEVLAILADALGTDDWEPGTDGGTTDAGENESSDSPCSCCTDSETPVNITRSQTVTIVTAVGDTTAPTFRNTNSAVEFIHDNYPNRSVGGHKIIGLKVVTTETEYINL